MAWTLPPAGRWQGAAQATRLLAAMGHIAPRHTEMPLTAVRTTEVPRTVLGPRSAGDRHDELHFAEK
jgi:hypothetical protein